VVADPLHPLNVPKPNPNSNVSATPLSNRRRRAGTRSNKNPASAVAPITPLWFVAEFVRQLL
jgi:hypothetical protein